MPVVSSIMPCAVEHGRLSMGRYQSGQMGRTVNPLAYAYGGSNPSLPTIFTSEYEYVQQAECMNDQNHCGILPYDYKSKHENLPAVRAMLL